MTLALVAPGLEATSPYDSDAHVLLDPEVITVDWAAALADANGGTLTLNLASGPVTYTSLVKQPGLGASYKEVMPLGVTSVTPLPHDTFRGVIPGVSDSWVVLTIGPKYFGGSAYSGPDDHRVFRPVEVLGTGLITVQTHSSTLASFLACQPGCNSGSTSTLSSSSSYTPVTLDVMLEADSRLWNYHEQRGSSVWTMMQNGFHEWEVAFSKIDVNLEVPIMWAWTAGGPASTHCSVLIDEIREGRQRDRSHHSRAYVLFHVYHEGPLTTDDGYAGGCAARQGAGFNTDYYGYAVFNTDDPNNLWKKAGHESGHIFDAPELSASAAAIPGTPSCGGRPDKVGLMGAGGDTCKLFEFSSNAITPIRNCVDNWSSCS